jgi:hypothetical protein
MSRRAVLFTMNLALVSFARTNLGLSFSVLRTHGAAESRDTFKSVVKKCETTIPRSAEYPSSSFDFGLTDSETTTSSTT